MSISIPRWAALHLTRVHPLCLLPRLLARLEVSVVTMSHARAALSNMTPLSPGPSCWLMPLATPGVYVGARVTIVTIPVKKYSQKSKVIYILSGNPLPLCNM